MNLYHLTTHSTTVLAYKMAIVLRPQICDLISPYLLTQIIESSAENRTRVWVRAICCNVDSVACDNDAICIIQSHARR